MPMWDPAGAKLQAWLPDVRRHLEALPVETYRTVWLSDHLVPGANWAPPEWDTLECLSATIHFATAFPRFRYGQIVLGNSFRPPALLAKQFATAQALTGARFILGIGAGWMESEYRMYGYEYPLPKVRIGQLADAVQLIRKIWTESPASFAGQYHSIDAAYAEPRPDEPPIVMIGGSGEQLTLRVVAKHADWWNASGGTPEQVAQKRAVLAEHCQKVDRDVDDILVNWQCQCLAIGDSEDEARRIAESAPLFSRERSAIYGTPEQVAEKLQGFVDVGVRDFILRFADFPRTENALRFAREIVPKLRGR
jgi:alkanesulfonate monooxygenase SsuD/methylene tetrahydromethanopterin reductase-like flavin-dependent oxidoreductase (luciferase family)